MRSTTLRPLAAAVALAAAASACGGKALGSETQGQQIRAATGFNVSLVPPAKRTLRPSFAGVGMDGKRISSGDLRGHVTVVNFWASWCGPCRAEQATLERVWKDYRAQDVLFLGINVRDTRVDAGAHIAEFGVTYPSVFNRDASIAFRFRVLFIPTTYVLDPDGRVAAKIIGAARSVSDLTAILDRELERSSASR
jgi:thiol-disulfide isomerase/thioredoxin